MLTNNQVRAELERIDKPERTLPWLFKMMKKPPDTAVSLATIKALRRLAESLAALGEIAEKEPHDYIWAGKTCDRCKAMIAIARNAVKGGSNETETVFG